ncbi:Methyltransferase domain-containing protein [Eubacterium ruminantium]|nr:Methyltransferase domain-containing protein [Eubacterium ruminantium]
MNKTAIKNFAVWARVNLIEAAQQRAYKYEITEDGANDVNAEVVRGRLLSKTEKNQRKQLFYQVKAKGFDQVMEEAAYTWFNRFIALRFMEVNGYLPNHVRVFSDENGEFKPQILAEALHLELPGLDMNKVLQYKEEANEEELFKYLLKVQCNALNEILPQMFQKIEDYTELLLPDYLLREGSVIEKLVDEIPEDNFDVNTENGQIEVIGWMYQYYISAKHEEVVDPLHGKVVKKEEVPAATQLFTTDWVVRYLIDNSVGRYWVERNPESKLADELTYFVKPKDGVIKTVDEKITPQDVTVFDPCVGSGHFLIYAFDVLMKIYVEYGFSERDAASEIVKNNLFGLDIDGRAAQLAYFAVMMKARQYDRRFLTRGIQPNVYEITESNGVDKASVEYFYKSDINLKKDVDAILDTLKDAKEYGSILQMPDADYEKINERFAEIDNEISIYKPYLLGDFRTLIRSAEIMSRKYAVVATNPPYLNKYDQKLKTYIVENYSDYKGDLFSVFIYRNFDFCKEGGYSGFMTPMVWMFILTYEKLRGFIIENKRITTLIQFEYSAYEEATVPICSFVLQNSMTDIKGLYFRLSDFKGGMEVQKAKTLEALSGKTDYFYEADQSNYLVIPSTPIAYWLSNTMFEIFRSSQSLSEVAKPRQGLATSDNDRFLRFWQEVELPKIGFEIQNIEDSEQFKYKWFPCTKGGNFRRWYGNNYYVINWENDGEEIKAYAASLYKNYTRTIKNIPLYFKKGLTWSTISSGLFSLRYVPTGFIFETKGAMCFVDDKYLYGVLALYNTNVMQSFLQVISPTLDYHEGSLGRTPIKLEADPTIDSLTSKCVELSKKDWDSFETSWDFETHPFIKVDRSNAINGGAFAVANTAHYYEEGPEASCPIEASFMLWKGECNARFQQLKENEEELNRIFIDIYGLQDELTPEVEDKDVTVRLADLQRDIRSFISYAVGCMFGRYSLDVPGLAYAGGDWDASKYKTFQADSDAIIPICDDEYFEDDIVERFVKFVEVVYGKDTLEDNLKFIADALGGNGTSREVIRNYFINDFYADHVKIYQKRPIYWLFDSGKKNGFKCLIYMHRYQPDTIARIRTDYIHELQGRYRTAIADLEDRVGHAAASEKVKLNKQLSKIKDQELELHQYEEKIHHLADQMIMIDLDDGVKVNYAKFGDVLAKIK